MTVTRIFGSSTRESHDASRFYSQDGLPAHVPGSIKFENELTRVTEVDVDGDVHGGDAVALDLPDCCAGLVVTSPPYFAAKEYDTGTWDQYVDLLRSSIGEAFRVLEPGGRIAFNVAGLGRRPYIPLPHLVAQIMTETGFLLRGEVVWVKAAGSGSCAWGSFRSPSNPTLRDLTERVVIASKEQFGRCGKPTERRDAGLPHRSTITKTEFMEATLDVWNIPPESAKRVGHPAPFPVALPRRVIELYTFEGDLVVDPFAGAGTTGIAAKQTGRRFYGVDLNPEYVDLANTRISQAQALTP